VHHEVERLYNAGYINERREGRNRLIRARIDSVIAEPLTTLLALSYGPVPIIEDALTGAKGITQAFIFGSWAKRYSGEIGGVPNDIDLGVIGSASTNEIEDLLEDARKILRRDIDVKKFTLSNWNEGSSMIDEIKSSPHYFLDLK
jgi:predicted nucleotidyltransferase